MVLEIHGVGPDDRPWAGPVDVHDPLPLPCQLMWGLLTYPAALTSCGPKKDGPPPKQEMRLEKADH